MLRSVRKARRVNCRSVDVRNGYKDILLEILQMQTQQFLNKFGWIQSHSDLRHPSQMPLCDNGVNYEDQISEYINDIQSLEQDDPRLYDINGTEPVEGKNSDVASDRVDSQDDSYCNMDAYLNSLRAPTMSLFFGILILIVAIPSAYFYREQIQSMFFYSFGLIGQKSNTGFQSCGEGQVHPSSNSPS